MHNFGENDTVFNSVESVLKNILSLGNPAPDSFIQDFTRDEKRIRSSSNFFSKLLTDPQACLQSLSFPEMKEREYDVADPTKNTCIWLAKDPVYMAWLKQRHGLLWIKGHPGV